MVDPLHCTRICRRGVVSADHRAAAGALHSCQDDGHDSGAGQCAIGGFGFQPSVTGRAGVQVQHLSLIIEYTWVGCIPTPTFTASHIEISAPYITVVQHVLIQIYESSSQRPAV